ncbi:MAG: TIGR00730 family Rossman fold protein [Bacteroidia bacterium]|nr:TIGR00730 family Rossman fold protein [Bacteroidia bacterium]
MQNKKSPSAISVVVYCASSSQIDTIYFEAAERLGQLLAQNGIACINGAGKQGLMGALNNSLLQCGGTVKGIIPRFMIDSGWCHSGLNELLVTETMHHRKAKMAELSDAAIALPGGLGTLEELAEILTWKQLGLYKKPIIILNINGFYNPLLTMFEKMMDEKFLHAGYRNLWRVVDTPDEIIECLQNFETWEPSFGKYEKKEL